MSEKRKGSASPSPEVQAKRQRLDGPVRSSSSGLSSLESDEEPLATSATAKTSGKMVSAVPSRLLPDNDSMAPSDSEASSPEPQPKHHPSGKTSKKSHKSKTSQKGPGMARTVGATAQMPSSPDALLSAKQARSSPIKPVKQEELDSAQVTLVAAGVSIDAEDLTMQTAFTKERPAISEEKAGIIEFRTVSNEDSTPQNSVILTGLKNIFQRQLPKMPREYIARLVFDRNHISMAIVKHGLQVVGGITYRPFQQRAFAEIVFCAITGTEQVRGYGNHLMNHLKDFVRSAHPGIEYFLTYADNYAVGYFKKQGFTKEITLERELWAAYIKDYEGGTLMQCSMLPRIKYLQARETLMGQREAILAKIRQMSKSHVVYSGRDIFPEGVTSVDPSTVPGLRDLNWNPAMDELSRRPQRGPHFMMMQRLLTDMQGHASAWPFLRPVNRDEVADYYEVIKEPMDLETMETKLEANMYDDMPAFMADAQRIFNNCRMYNSETSNYVKNANKLEKFLNARAKEIAP